MTIRSPRLTAPVSQDVSWLDRAECRHHDPELFFTPDRGGRDDPIRVRLAKRICAACPVTTQCAVTFWEDRWAIVAGTTPDERREQ